MWFDPAQVSRDQLLQAFWRSTTRRPETAKGGGTDIGNQYRSAIFVHDADQAALAITSRDPEQRGLTKPIVTEITPAGTFYEAEDHPQRYFEKPGRAARAITLC